mmetsp:Transcript_24551/g.53415  ORF Transcript_24551/g.53415 Transcript_24551/m.53415 type:complete len:284 (+) Transcript_24551:78-929(+)
MAVEGKKRVSKAAKKAAEKAEAPVVKEAAAAAKKKAKRKAVSSDPAKAPEVKKAKSSISKKVKEQIAKEDAEADGEMDSDIDEQEKGEVTEKKPKQVKSKANRLAEMAEAQEHVPRGLIYIGHVPDGFNEPQMKTFFKQFGTVTNLRLSRNKKTAASKGYGWVEFEEEAVAKIVAEAMDGYMCFGRKLKVELIPKDKRPSNLFICLKGRRLRDSRGSARKEFREKFNGREEVEVDGEKLPAFASQQVNRRGKKAKDFAAKLKSLGVDMDIASIFEGTAKGTDI